MKLPRPVITRSRNDQITPLLVLLILLAYTYALFFRACFPGFQINGVSGTISKFFIDPPPNSLHLGDRIIQVGSLSYSRYRGDLRLSLFDQYQPGQMVDLVVERDGQRFVVPWIIPGSTWAALTDRLLNMWWLGYVFWGFGTAALLVLRPKDTRWRVMVAFDYLTALWLVIGAVSNWGTWYSSVIYRMALWASLPVMLHLHWVFPKRLGPLPKWIFWGVYGLGAVLTLLQAFQSTPHNMVFFGFAITVGASIALLSAHHFRQPGERRALGLLIGGSLFSLLPVAAVSVISFWQVSFPITFYALLAFPVLPLVYFYAAYRRHLGGLELRANRVISVYFFITSLAAVYLVSFSLISAWIDIPQESLILNLLTPVLLVLFSLWAYPHFERWIERRLLGIPLPQTQLLEAYAARISTSLETRKLIRLLQGEILPSLLVRESALLRYGDVGNPFFLYRQEVEPDWAPDSGNLKILWRQAGHYRTDLELEAYPEIAWVRLAIPLQIGAQRIGLWLLGRRDPDDFYAQVEIRTIQALANQTAVALLNIDQSDRLSRLYQADIDRQENERLHLALELHDSVLNQLAVLTLVAEGRNEAFDEAYQAATTRIREIISGLRPMMLNYGLRTALDELADDAPAQVGGEVEIWVDLPPVDTRYDPQIELHLYRIVQEACQNALQHAAAKTIKISGWLEPAEFHLLVEDDGVGFEKGEAMDLDGLLSAKHFGLAGMIERANLIGAQMEIDSSPGRGTRIRVRKKF